MRSIKMFFYGSMLLLIFMQGCSDSGKEFNVPVEYYKLENGLKVVLSADHTSPTVTIAVYYNIGFRIEPKNRTGFAHLFEHMMFQGSKNLGKMEFIRLVNQNGGVMNGSTRFDFTNYFEIVPSYKLETFLWAEADRMKGLDITQENLTNQKGVVINEVKVNVLNRPYGGFPWLDLPQYANENWYNAHNFYGDLTDLENANLEDVQSFFDKYYAPNNAALVVVGDFEPSDAKNFIEKYFGNIDAAELPPAPDISEPEQTMEKFASKRDKLAPRPAIAVGYHMPARNTPEYFAMGIIDQILLQGNDSRLYQRLVQKEGITGDVSGGINLLGNMFNYNGPDLWVSYLFHDEDVSAERITTIFDEEVEKLIDNKIDQETLDRSMVKMRSSFYDMVSATYGFGKADLLASFALFDDNPARINDMENEFRKVTPELIQQTAQKFLRKTNRTILTLIPEGKI